jgi:TonB family protein
MSKKGIFSVALACVLAMAAWAQSTDPAGAASAAKPAWGMMKLRVFEGQKEGTVEPVKVVTTSFLNYTVTASIQSEADASAQQAKIKDIFNLKGVSLLTEADLVWDKGRTEKAFHFFRLGDKDYLVLVTPVDIPRLRFRIEVIEQKGSQKTSLLDTEFTLAPKNAAVFGFGAADGKPYFLSMQTIKWPSEVDAKIILGSDAVPPDGPVRAIGSIKPPRLINLVDPIYPEAARKAGAEGVVILEAQTDINGRVENTKILRSIPLLDRAAMEAVRQWVYEPAIIEGKPRGIIFTVTVRFTTNDGRSARSGTDGGAAGGVVGGVIGNRGVEKPTVALSKDEAERLQKMPPIKAEGNIQPPKLIQQIDPAYPESARRERVEGVVILSATINIHGRVEDAQILRSIPALDNAAIEAVRQWIYEPFIFEGKPRRCLFTVTVRFTLKDRIDG